MSLRVMHTGTRCDVARMNLPPILFTPLKHTLLCVRIGHARPVLYDCCTSSLGGCLGHLQQPRVRGQLGTCCSIFSVQHSVTINRDVIASLMLSREPALTLQGDRTPTSAEWSQESAIISRVSLRLRHVSCVITLAFGCFERCSRVKV